MMEEFVSSRLSARFTESLLCGAEYLHNCHLSCLTSCENDLRGLANITQKPFNISVFGRMKTGKSSLINALIGQPLAITGTEEATATVNLITYTDDPNLLDKYTVHWIGAPAETYPLSSLQKDWTGKSDDVIERVRRVKYIQLYSNYESLRLHEIIDTPGTGSEAAEHEKAAQNVLNCFADVMTENGMHSDALVYVFPPVGRENDEDVLRTFRESCVPDSSPYNSVGVLHKWDHIFAEILEGDGDLSDLLKKARASIQQKADRLKDAMDGMLADVFPVSAPLASAAAQDEFLIRMHEIIKLKGENINRLLSRDERWDRDTECREVRQLAGDLPWASFQIIVRVCLKSKPFNLTNIKDTLLDISGLSEFRNFLDRKFFARGAMIRQKQNLAKLEKIHKTALKALEKKKKNIQMDGVYWEDLYSKMQSDLKVGDWVAEKYQDNKDKYNDIEKKLIEIDKMFMNGDIRQTILNMETLNWSLTESNSLFDDRERNLIQSIFNSICSISISLNADEKNDVSILQRKLKLYQFYPDYEVRKYTQHMLYCINKFQADLFNCNKEDTRS